MNRATLLLVLLTTSILLAQPGNTTQDRKASCELPIKLEGELARLVEIVMCEGEYKEPMNPVVAQDLGFGNRDDLRYYFFMIPKVTGSQGIHSIIAIIIDQKLHLFINWRSKSDVITLVKTTLDGKFLESFVMQSTGHFLLASNEEGKKVLTQEKEVWRLWLVNRDTTNPAH